VCALALAPATASASASIGMTMFPSVVPGALNCLKSDPPQFDTATLIQYQRQAGSTPAYTVPAGGGVITSWAHMAPDPIGFAETAALKVLRPAGGTQFTVVGQSAVATLFNGFNSFPTQIPVQAGDFIGLYVQHQGNTAYCQEEAPVFNDGDKTREVDGTQNAPIGTTLDFTAASEQAARLSVSAVIEPDVDGDGLGDETQDPSTPSAPDAVAPDTTVSGKKRFKAKKNAAKAKFTFSADEAGSTFMCRLDARPFAACTSPSTVKAKLGTHVFTVVATDTAGNADPTAAAKQFKVVRAK
jgi:hypothetical protein